MKEVRNSLTGVEWTLKKGKNPSSLSIDLLPCEGDGLLLRIYDGYGGNAIEISSREAREIARQLVYLSGMADALLEERKDEEEE